MRVSEEILSRGLVRIGWWVIWLLLGAYITRQRHFFPVSYCVGGSFITYMFQHKS